MSNYSNINNLQIIIIQNAAYLWNNSVIEQSIHRQYLAICAHEVSYFASVCLLQVCLY